MNMRNWFEVTTSLLGGAGIGAAVMYLFDPDRGDNRRAYLGKQAADAAASAEAALESGWHAVSDRARSAGRYIAAQAGGAASDASDWVDDTKQSAARQARGAMQQARGYGRNLHRSAGSYMGYNEGPSAASVGSVAAGVIGALAVGAGLMYLLDPEQGRKRRAAARDKAVDYGRTAGHYVQDAASSVADHARSAAQTVGNAAEQLKNKVTGTAEKVSANSTSSSLP